MFSALKFLVAGAIVALFGGFLMAGLLSQPSDDMAPAAVSASPSPTTTEDLLSGMETREVEPGILRVLDDGAGHDLVADPPVGLTVAPDGSVWLLRGARPPDPGTDPDWGTDLPAYADAVYRLGQEGTFAFEPGISSYPFFADLAVGRDGTAWTVLARDEWGPGLLGSFDGPAWSYPTWPDGSSAVAAIETTLDGSVWVTQGVEDGPGPRVARIVDGTWTVLPTLEDPALAGYFHGSPEYFAAAPDGTAWLANGDFHLGGMTPAPTGLLHFDGESWEVVDLPTDKAWKAGPLALGADGTLWVHLKEDTGCCIPQNDEQPYLARLDGDGWRLFATGVPQLVVTGVFDAPMAVAADGTLWAGTTQGVVAFDGDTSTRYRYSHGWITGIGVAPDGTVFATGGPTWSDAGLYVITPEAVAGTE